MHVFVLYLSIDQILAVRYAANAYHKSGIELEAINIHTATVYVATNYSESELRCEGL